MPPYKTPTPRRRKPRPAARQDRPPQQTVRQRATRQAGAPARRVMTTRNRVALARAQRAGFRGSQRAYHSQDRNPAQLIHKRRTQAKQRKAYRDEARRYDAYTERLWARAGRYYPPGKQPKTRPLPLTLNPKGDLSYGPALAFVLRGKRAIHVTPSTVYDLTSRDRGLNDYAHSVPLHEWGHVFQSPETLRQPRWMIEGGAEALEQVLASRVGLRSSTNSRYAPWAKRIRRRGLDYVLREQLGGR